MKIADDPKDFDISFGQLDMIVNAVLRRNPPAFIEVVPHFWEIVSGKPLISEVCLQRKLN